ncbi:hypothetical protein U716_09245 [Rhodobacter capsulatus B6]|nr:hypothetical protein U716_09245 [Rhodobacter capsulatus B6]
MAPDLKLMHRIDQLHMELPSSSRITSSSLVRFSAIWPVPCPRKFPQSDVESGRIDFGQPDVDLHDLALREHRFAPRSIS